MSDIMEASKEKLASCKTEEEREKMMFVIYKELTDRVESVGSLILCDLKALESLEYKLKDLRRMDQE